MITAEQFSELLEIQRRMERRLDELSKKLGGTEPPARDRITRADIDFYARNPEQLKRKFGGRK